MHRKTGGSLLRSESEKRAKSAASTEPGARPLSRSKSARNHDRSDPAPTSESSQRMVHLSLPSAYQEPVPDNDTKVNEADAEIDNNKKSSKRYVKYVKSTNTP